MTTPDGNEVALVFFLTWLGKQLKVFGIFRYNISIDGPTPYHKRTTLTFKMNIGRVVGP